MREDDPLEDWLFYESIEIEEGRGLSKEQIDQALASLMKDLARLEEFLDNPQKRHTLYDFIPHLYFRAASEHLSVSQLAWMQELYRRVVLMGGTGTIYIQEAFLETLAWAGHPSIILFWLGMLEFTVPRRETFKDRRVTIALAALGLMATRHQTGEAQAVLRQLLAHKHPEVRSQALYSLGMTYVFHGRALPDDLRAQLTQIAIQDAAFGPRYMARYFLDHDKIAIPLDNPDGVYIFRVRFLRAKRMLSRSIALQSGDTLDHLCWAIQRSLGWDTDHLYCFYMDGVERQSPYRIACPYEDQGPYTSEAVIGGLGLVKRHKFMYLFDYGDNHEFEIEVEDILPQAEPGEYPRVVASKGEAPAQYG